MNRRRGGGVAEMDAGCSRRRFVGRRPRGIVWNFYEQLMNLFIAQIALGQRGVVRVSYSARFICMCAP